MHVFDVAAQTVAAALQTGQIGRPRLETEQADPRADGAAADEHNAAAGRTDCVDLLGQAVDPLVVERAIVVGEDAGADFHDDRVGGSGELLAEFGV